MLEAAEAVSSVCREIGRLREVFESREEGRCCHDRVPPRERVVALVLERAEDLVGDSGRGRGVSSRAEVFTGSGCAACSIV
jgi:hypothetical protein